MTDRKPSWQLLLDSAETKDKLGMMLAAKGKFADAVDVFRWAERCRMDAGRAFSFYKYFRRD